MSPVVLVVDLADFPLVAVVQLVLVVVLVVDAAGVGVQAPLVRLRLRVKLVRRSRPSARGVQWNFEARLQVALNSNNFQLWFEQKQNIVKSFHWYPEILLKSIKKQELRFVMDEKKFRNDSCESV